MVMDQLSYGSYGLIAFATIFFSLILRHALGGKDTQRAKANLPPGPWNLPVIGSLHHLASTKLAHRALLRLSRRHGPLMLLRLGEVPTVIVSSPEAAMEVLKTNDLAFATRPTGPTMDVVGSGGKGLVFAPYGEHWRQMRKVCVMEVLSARQVRRIESVKQDEVAHLVGSVAAAAASSGAVMDLGRALAELASNVIARAVFGGKCPQQEVFLRDFNAITQLLGGFSVVDMFPSSRLVRWLSGGARAVRRSHARLQRILAEIIVEREKKLPSGAAGDDEDLLDVLLRLRKEDTLDFPLTSENISAVIFDIFGAATDTTAATLEWAMAELVRNPHVMARAKLEVRQTLGQGRSTITTANIGDLRYLRMVIKETLRLHPVAAMILRASQKDCQVMGYDIPKGTHVTVNAFAVGRDTRHWGEDADEFRPERFEENDGANNVEYKQGTHMEFVPFGAGRRQCPGALFATTTIELVLANLLYRFDWAIPGRAGPETMDMSEVFGMILRPRSSLCLQPITNFPSTESLMY